jgi:hypothetical protein
MRVHRPQNDFRTDYAEKRNPASDAASWIWQHPARRTGQGQREGLRPGKDGKAKMPFPDQFRTVRRPVGRKKKLASFETSLIGCRKTTYRRSARNRQVQKSCSRGNRRGCDLFATVARRASGVYGGALFVESAATITDRGMPRNGDDFGRSRGKAEPTTIGRTSAVGVI